jgi:archaellum component FlaF (FlaF/FlaG flagellin family)
MSSNLIAKGIVGVAVASAFKDEEVVEAMSKLRKTIDAATDEDVKALGEKEKVSLEQIVGAAIVTARVVRVVGRVIRAVRGG